MLRATNVTKEYQSGDARVKALDDVSLEIQDGQFASIVGKSGSGQRDIHRTGQFGYDRPEVARYEGLPKGVLGEKQRPIGSDVEPGRPRWQRIVVKEQRVGGDRRPSDREPEDGVERGQRSELEQTRCYTFATARPPAGNRSAGRGYALSRTWERSARPARQIRSKGRMTRRAA